ncbi:MAG: hypothetical protein AB7E09_05720 [Candidatus Izemoplasmatales bacterium]|uniref:Uncharacterized protein n=1 Tax=Hujiaoplasma nucleasis TaxID=2725268 RepID=A0A7L6N2Z1_9MOLU|nr:hypothetical protein [Hujiaoplasma nucleasis]QLY39597.1 hypothetical protein HF295_01455 [Hujiaoplasma nucleasis]
MNKYFTLWKSLKEEVGKELIFEALLASIFYSLLVFFPAVLMMIQVISMYYHRLNFLVMVLGLVVILISMLQLWLWKKSLFLNHNGITTDVRKLFRIQFVIHAVLILIIALLFVFVFIPIMQI